MIMLEKLQLIVVVEIVSFEIPGMPGANVGMINIEKMLGKSMGAKKKRKNDCKESMKF